MTASMLSVTVRSLFALLLFVGLGNVAVAQGQTVGPVRLVCTASNWPGLPLTTYTGSYVREGEFGNLNDPDQVHLGSVGVTFVNGQNAGVIVDVAQQWAYVVVPIEGVWVWAVFEW